MAKKIKNPKKSTSQKQKINQQLKTKVVTGIKDNVFIYTDALTISEFANKSNIPLVKIIKHFFDQGLMYNQNMLLNEEQIGELCLTFGFDFKKEVTVTHKNVLDIINKDIDKSKLEKRSPIVTIMGHVDHGKTTLLDYIRRSNIIKQEHGGITQHIGAYSIKHHAEKITFIDTPGHEIFRDMRARGSQVTDVIIIVIATNDGVKPQTVEAIEFAKAANVPIIVFLNKIDLPNPKTDLIYQQINDLGLIPEEWGGDIPVVKGSAKTGQQIDELLDTIILIAELQNLQANYEQFATGVVIEAKVTPAVGPICTLLIQNGILQLKDYIVAGNAFGRIRKITNSNKKSLLKAFPSDAVQIQGLDGVPQAGETFVVFEDEKLARSISTKRKRETIIEQRTNNLSLFANQAQDGQIEQINLIVKADTNGTLEALKSTIEKITSSHCKYRIIRHGVGIIGTSDVELAKVTQAIIIGFNVRPTLQSQKNIQEQKITVMFKNVIYQITEELEAILEGKKAPTTTENMLGQAEIKKLFYYSKIGTIAGCLVIKGKVVNQAEMRLVRQGKVIYTGSIKTLQREQNQVKEVTNGYECGITITNYNDLKVEDIIEVFETVTT